MSVSQKDRAMSCRPGWKFAACLWLLLSGCAMWDGSRNWFGGGLGGQSEPDVEADKWASVGQEARGNYPREKADWFERYVWSEKARDINRSLGFD